MYEVVIFGEASQRNIKVIPITKCDLDKTILEFLEENKIPVASSCLGEGVCKKCVINGNTLSCLKLVKDILNWNQAIISISYL